METHAFRKMTPVNNESDIVRPSFTLGDPPIFVISKANPNPSLTLPEDTGYSARWHIDTTYSTRWHIDTAYGEYFSKGR